MKKLMVCILIFFLASAVVFCSDNSIFSLVSLIFSGGMDYGSIVAVEEFDGVTSASKVGAHAGVHAEIGISGQYLETGLDYEYFNHEKTYYDPAASLDGRRTFSLHAINLPLLYNFRFFKDENGNPRLIVGTGIFASYFPYQDVKDYGSLSDYDLENWMAGLFVRISYFPLNINEKNQLGIYLNFYRSMMGVYSDDYYSGWLNGNLGVLDLGLTFKYKL